MGSVARGPGPLGEDALGEALWDVVSQAGRLSSAGARWVALVAGHAPSIHNTQPWRFVWDSVHLDLYADRTRHLPVADPEGRQLVMSCGAALMQARLGLAALGRRPDVRLLPDPHEPDHLARLTVGPVDADAPMGEVWALMWAVPRRHTVRTPFPPGTLSPTLLAALGAAADAEGACLRLVDNRDERATIAELIEVADRLQQARPDFQAELRAWVHDGHRDDGIPSWACGPGWMGMAGEFRLRHFDVLHEVAATPSGRRRDAPTIALLHTPDDTPLAWLRTGQALARLLLVATCSGVGASLLDQPIEVEGTRDALGRALSIPGAPHALLRLGQVTGGRATSRRPVAEIFTDRSRGAVTSL